MLCKFDISKFVDPAETNMFHVFSQLNIYFSNAYCEDSDTRD
jgi:hypothetical protein